jgi:hypothetical protein
MLPRNVSPLVTRLKLKGSSKCDLMGILEQLEAAAGKETGTPTHHAANARACTGR